MNEMKTGALIKCAALYGAILGKAPVKDYNNMESFGIALGKAFQIRDDILDVQGDEQVLGKKTNKDKIKGKLSLIDLESYGSFKFVFNGKKEWYEKFDLNAWWKPLETARRDLDLFYKDYLFQCLDITYKKKINSEERLREIVKLVKDS